jgi:hypothetical protein
VQQNLEQAGQRLRYRERQVLSLCKIAEYQFEQRHNEREESVRLISATQDRSLKRRCLRGTPPIPGNVGHLVGLLVGFLAQS